MKHSITQTQYVHASRDFKGDIAFHLFATDMEAYGYTMLLPVEVIVPFELPDDFDLTQKEIEALKKEKNRVLAEAQLRATQIEEKIQSLLCIDHKE